MPFDPDLRILEFSTQAGYSYAAQASKIRALNRMVYESTAIEGVKDVISAIYGLDPQVEPNWSSATYNASYVPPGWRRAAGSPRSDDKEKLYKEVIHPYCINCHATGDSNAYGVGSPGMLSSFSQLTTFGNLPINDICSNTHLMPHAQRTALHLWTSPARAYLLAALGSTAICDP